MAWIIETRGAKRKRLENSLFLSEVEEITDAPTASTECSNEYNFIGSNFDIEICDACEEQNASSNCIDCPMLLCDKCLKIHRRIKVSADHRVSDIDSPPTTSQSETTEKCWQHPTRALDVACYECLHDICQQCEKEEHRGHRTAFLNTPDMPLCPFHSDETLSMCCLKCIEVICDKCLKNEHLGHGYTMIKGNRETCYMLSRKYGQDLCDYYQVFLGLKKDIHDIITTQTKSIEAVDQLENELNVLVKENSQRLRREIKGKRNKYESCLAHGSWLYTLMEDIDLSIDTLQKLRSVTNCDVLSQHLAKAKVFFNRLNDYKNKYVTHEIPSVDDILRNRQDLDIVTNGIRKLLTTSLTKESIIEIGPLEGSSSSGYKFCEVGVDSTDLYLYKGKYVYKVALSSYAIERFTSNIDIFSMAQLSQSEYVCFGENNTDEQIFVLDRTFSKRFGTVSRGKENQQQVHSAISCVSRVADNTFLCSLCPRDNPWKNQYVQKLKVEDGNFTCAEETRLTFGYPAPDIDQIKKHPKNRKVYIGANKQLYTLNPDTFAVENKDHRDFMSIFCPTRRGEILIGVGDEIRILENPPRHSSAPMYRTIAELDGEDICDLIVVGDRLFCSSRSVKDKVHRLRVYSQ